MSRVRVRTKEDCNNMLEWNPAHLGRLEGCICKPSDEEPENKNCHKCLGQCPSILQCLVCTAAANELVTIRCEGNGKIIVAESHCDSGKHRVIMFAVSALMCLFFLCFYWTWPMCCAHNFSIRTFLPQFSTAIALKLRKLRFFCLNSYARKPPCMAIIGRRV